MNLRFILLRVLTVIWVATTFGSALADNKDVVKANNRFAFELYRRIGAKTGNLFVSPYSISTALAMTRRSAWQDPRRNG